MIIQKGLIILYLNIFNDVTASIFVPLFIKPPPFQNIFSKFSMTHNYDIIIKKWGCIIKSFNYF